MSEHNCDRGRRLSQPRPSRWVLRCGLKTQSVCGNMRAARRYNPHEQPLRNNFCTTAAAEGEGSTQKDPLGPCAAFHLRKHGAKTSRDKPYAATPCSWEPCEENSCRPNCPM